MASKSSASRLLIKNNGAAKTNEQKALLNSETKKF